MEGHDPCLGEMPGITDACCGHGITKPYFVRRKGLDSDRLIRVARRLGRAAQIVQNEDGTVVYEVETAMLDELLDAIATVSEDSHSGGACG